METVKQILDSKPPRLVTINGWIKTARRSPNLGFLEINDGSCLTSIQVIVETKRFGAILDQLNLGLAIRVEGELVPSPAPKQPVEVIAKEIAILGEHDFENYPIQKKHMTLEYLREIAHLRARTNTISCALRIRSTVSNAIHRFFQERDFFYVHTPIITGSDCEGAGEMFRVTTLPLNSADTSQDFFGKPAYLTVSGQLEGEALALALGRIYTFGPTFRAENSNTSRHLAEFWMIEPEMAFYDLAQTIDLAVDLLKFCSKMVLDNHSSDLEWLEKYTGEQLVTELIRFMDTKVQVITYTDAINLLRGSGCQFEFEPRWGNDLQTEHERFLSEAYFKGPVVVTNYPKSIKAFYMYQNDDNETVACMDFLLPKVGETIGGSQREHRYQKLLTRILELGLDREVYEWYLDLRKFGSAPHSGFGLGLERFLVFLTGLKNVRDVIPFPRVPGYLEF
ncbi:MAG: asparagine--tRNA ligase [Deltaproteobacteria bacterium]|nr:asparagine--tRNA ligase [Deltaproteobacteria bacterium]